MDGFSTNFITSSTHFKKKNCLFIYIRRSIYRRKRTQKLAVGDRERKISNTTCVTVRNGGVLTCEGEPIPFVLTEVDEVRYRHPRPTAELRYDEAKVARVWKVTQGERVRYEVGKSILREQVYQLSFRLSATSLYFIFIRTPILFPYEVDENFS